MPQGSLRKAGIPASDVLRVKYLGVVFNASSKLLVDTNSIKRKFYTACNCLLGNTYSLNDILCINIQDSYCLPILQYTTAAVQLTKAQISELLELSV